MATMHLEKSGENYEFFDSLDAVIHEAENRKTDWPEYELASRDNMSFQYFDSWEDAVQAAKYGWPEGRDKMAKATADAIAMQRQSMLPLRVLDVAGGYPIAPLAAAGDPACMVDVRPEITDSVKVVSLYVNASMAARVTVNEVINYYGAVLAWVDRLENAGFRLEINWTNNRNAGRPYNAITVVRIKEAHSAMDFDRVAFALCNPDMNRRIGFSLVERWNQTIWTDYGTASKTCPKKFKDDGASIFIPGVGADRKGLGDPVTASQRVKNEILATDFGFKLLNDQDAA